VFVRPPLVRRRRPSRVRSASSVAVRVRLPSWIWATVAACYDDRGGPFESASKPSLTAALAQLSKKA
jgi:hypothetical protein